MGFRDQLDPADLASRIGASVPSAAAIGQQTGAQVNAQGVPSVQRTFQLSANNGDFVSATGSSNLYDVSPYETILVYAQTTQPVRITHTGTLDTSDVIPPNQAVQIRARSSKVAFNSLAGVAMTLFVYGTTRRPLRDIDVDANTGTIKRYTLAVPANATIGQAMAMNDNNTDLHLNGRCMMYAVLTNNANKAQLFAQDALGTTMILADSNEPAAYTYSAGPSTVISKEVILPSSFTLFWVLRSGTTAANPSISFLKVPL